MTHNEVQMIGVLHNVSLPKMIDIPDQDFSVSETVITVGQYKSYCEYQNIKFPQQPEPYSENNPVTDVNYHEAVAYINWLSKLVDEEYRLPTEEEFIIYAGDHKKANKDIAVYGQSNITEVKTKKPNKYGLYDCLGLVWEWLDTIYED